MDEEDPAEGEGEGVIDEGTRVEEDVAAAINED